ncbi:hypothetical protein GCM10020220_051970 [Nonomuraea rubra]
MIRAGNGIPVSARRPKAAFPVGEAALRRLVGAAGSARVDADDHPGRAGGSADNQMCCGAPLANVELSFTKPGKARVEGVSVIFL